MSPSRKPSRPVDIYVRVSDVRGRGEELISTEIQEERCRAQLTALGLRAGEVFTDLDVSGMKESRPAFDTLKERIANGTSGGVVVYKLSRFGRNVKQVLTDVQWIEDQGALFVCVDPTIDTSTPTGRFVLTVFAALDEMEVGNIAVGWSLAKTKAVVERGIHISRHVPPGYTRPERENGTSLKTGRARKKIQGPLAPDPKYGPVVTEAFAMAAQGEHYNRIAAYLTEAGLPVAGQAGAVWESNRIKRLLANRVYLGEARSGHGDVNANAHPALVDPLTWQLAQRERTGPTISNEKTRMLAGICRCASCSYAMRSQAPRGSTVGTYRCRTTSPNGRCEHPATISLARLEDYVLARFLARRADLTLHQADEHDVDGSEAREAAEAAERRYRAALDDQELVAEIGDEDHRRMVASYHRAWQEALAAVPALPRSTQAAANEVDLAGLVEELQRREDVQGLRDLLATEIQAVFVRPAASRSRNLPIADRVRIVWADEPKLDLPKRGELFEPRPYTWTT